MGYVVDHFSLEEEDTPVQLIEIFVQVTRLVTTG